MELDLSVDDSYLKYNHQQKKLSVSQQEDQVKLQGLCQRREETCQSEITISKMQIEKTVGDKKDYQTSMNQSFDGSIIHQFGESSVPHSIRQTENGHYKSEYQIIFKQLRDSSKTQEQNLDSLPFLSINKQQTSTQSQLLNLERSRQQSKRQTYTHSPNARKESRLISKALMQKKRNSNKPDELQVLTKIKIRMNQFFKKYTQSGRRHFLQNPLIQQSINDKSNYFEKSSISHLQSKLETIELILKKCRFLQEIPLFNPQNHFCFFAQILFCLLNCIFFIFLSILAIFNPCFQNQNMIYLITFSFWVIEILVKINTSVYINTDLIQSRNQIIKMYLQHNFIYDFVPLLSIQLIQLYPISSIIFQVLCFIKLKNVVDDLCDFQKQICMAIKKYYYVQLFNLITKMFLIGHFIACLWYLICYIESLYLFNDDIWLYKGIGTDGTWWKLYLQSLFWALTLMTTGSNDAFTTLETFFTSFIMLFTSIMFCYFLNAIGNILADIDEEERQMKKDINIINEFMRKHSISRNLQRRVNKDLEHFYEKNYKKLKEDNEQVLEKISPHLKQQINKESYKKYIDKIEFLTKNFSSDTIEKICQNIQELYFTPNQIIINENQIDDLCLMYVIEGQVELYRKCERDPLVNQIIGIVEKESIIGQQSFLTGQQRIAGAKSKSFSTIIQISRENFLNIVKQNDEDFEKFCFIKDNIILYKNYYNLGVKCSVCKKFSHYSQDCPLTHFDKDSAFIKSKMYEKLKQKREQHQRKSKKFVNSLSVQKRIEEIAQLFDDSTFLQVKFNNQTVNLDTDEILNETEHEDDQSQVGTHSGYAKTNPYSLIQQQHEFEEDKKQKITFEHSHQLEYFCDSKKRSHSFDNRNKSINSKEEQEVKNRQSTKEEVNSSENRNNKVSFTIHTNINNFLTDSNNKVLQSAKEETISSNNRINFILKEESENVIKTKSYENQSSELSLRRPIEQINTKSMSNYMEQSLYGYPETPQPKLRKQSVFKLKKLETCNSDFDVCDKRIQQEYRKLLQPQFTNNEESNQLIHYQSPWMFDKQKDFDVYFPCGNLSITLLKYNRFIRRTQSIKKSPKKSQRK